MVIFKNIYDNNELIGTLQIETTETQHYTTDDLLVGRVYNLYSLNSHIIPYGKYANINTGILLNSIQDGYYLRIVNLTDYSGIISTTKNIYKNINNTRNLYYGGKCASEKYNRINNKLIRSIVKTLFPSIYYDNCYAKIEAGQKIGYFYIESIKN